jgi:transposase InsO family protein
VDHASKSGIQHYFSRVKTPKDNPEIERFNQTLAHTKPLLILLP